MFDQVVNTEDWKTLKQSERLVWINPFMYNVEKWLNVL